MNRRIPSREIRNNIAAKTSTIPFFNWFAALNLFRISRLGIGVLTIPAICSAAIVPINNPGFETTDSTPVADWGIQPPNTANPTEAYIYSPTTADYPSGIPGGVNVAHSDGPIIFQNTSAIVQPDTQYTLTYFVGNSATINDFVDYRAVLVANGLVITTDQDKPVPGAGDWVHATSTGGVFDDPEMVGYPISVVLEPLGGQVDWDQIEVSITTPNEGPPVSPEPASAMLLITAAPLWLRRKR